MHARTSLAWTLSLALPLLAACGDANQATNTRNGEGLNDEGARVATNEGPGARPQAGSVGTSGDTAAGADRPAQTNGGTDARAFVSNMLSDGQAEVALGRLANERAASPQVKAFAQQVAGDHANANDELAAIASRLNIAATPPDQAHAAAQQRLSQLKGAEFDREYVNAMVTSHQAAVDQLKVMRGGEMPSHHEQADGGRSAAPGAAAVGREARNDPNDLQPVHAWAAKVLPTVQGHLDRARELQQTTGRGDATSR